MQTSEVTLNETKKQDFSALHFAEGSSIVTGTVPGVKSQALLARQVRYEGSIVSYPRNAPIAIRRAKGAIIEDVDGNQFLDFFSFAGVMNLGHCNEEVLQYVFNQQRELIHALDFPTQNKVDVIDKILEHLPSQHGENYKVKVCFVGPTGADAIEAAVKLARIKTGREAIIVFTGGYHGITAGALSMTSDVSFRKKFSSLLAGVHFAPYSYCYRCAFKQTPETCQLDCADYLRSMLEDSHSGVPTPAAVVIEPIQGEGGNIVPRPGYLEEVVKICNKHGVLVIFDEIKAGFFRSGQFLSCMNTGAMPDIITVSKGLGGVGFPIAGLIYKREVEAWSAGDHVGTFRGNQVGLAATNGAFDFVDKYDLKENVDRISKLLFEGLENLKADCHYIGEVRGQGLMVGIEFVKDTATRAPFPAFVKQLKEECFQRGLIFEIGGHYSNVSRFLPPLIVTPKIIDACDMLSLILKWY